MLAERELFLVGNIDQPEHQDLGLASTFKMRADLKQVLFEVWENGNRDPFLFIDEVLAGMRKIRPDNKKEIDLSGQRVFGRVVNAQLLLREGPEFLERPRRSMGTPGMLHVIAGNELNGMIGRIVSNQPKVARRISALHVPDAGRYRTVLMRNNVAFMGDSVRSNRLAELVAKMLVDCGREPDATLIRAFKIDGTLEVHRAEFDEEELIATIGSRISGDALTLRDRIECVIGGLHESMHAVQNGRSERQPSLVNELEATYDVVSALLSAKAFPWIERSGGRETRFELCDALRIAECDYDRLVTKMCLSNPQDTLFADHNNALSEKFVNSLAGSGDVVSL